MKQNCRFYYSLIYIAFMSSFNNNYTPKDSPNNTDSSHRKHLGPNKKDTERISVKTDSSYNDSLKCYDSYQFANDTLAQNVFVYYITPKNIKFLIRVQNKKKVPMFVNIQLLKNG
jgi:hypothetical protein